jgi:CRISPR-associated protein Cas5t
MDIFKIDITSWTASFRYPNLMTAYQPTLEVPPLSTVLGLINAAAGEYLKHKQLSIGYYFDYEIKAENENGKLANKVTSDVIRREFLINPFLRIYTPDVAIAELFKQPYYQILLGRMNDLATVVKIEQDQLKKIPKAEKVRGQIVPLRGNFLAGQIQPLPKYFTDTFPRQNIGTEPYSVIGAHSRPLSANFEAYRDTVHGKDVDIYFHQLNFD